MGQIILKIIYNNPQSATHHNARLLTVAVSYRTLNGIRVCVHALNLISIIVVTCEETRCTVSPIPCVIISFPHIVLVATRLIKGKFFLVIK